MSNASWYFAPLIRVLISRKAVASVVPSLTGPSAPGAGGGAFFSLASESLRRRFSESISPASKE